MGSTGLWTIPNLLQWWSCSYAHHLIGKSRVTMLCSGSRVMGHDSLKGQFRVGSITEGHDFIGIHKHFTMEDT